MRFRLYFSDTCTIEDQMDAPKYLLNYRLVVYKPTLLKPILHAKISVRSIFDFLTFSEKFRIVYLYDEDTIIHYSYVTGKSFRFSFMKEDEFQIGPCFTSKAYRGQGIYKSVLFFLNNWNYFLDKKKWIYTRDTNIISQKAIEATGFKFNREIQLNKLTRIFRK